MPADTEPPPDPMLLGEGDPSPVLIERADGASPILLCCDHAGNAVPARLNGLGLPAAALDRHIGIDIGALGVAAGLAERLDAMLVAQRYSRLVIDCNRRPAQATSIPQISDGTAIPGNQGLSAVTAAGASARSWPPTRRPSAWSWTGGRPPAEPWPSSPCTASRRG